MLQAILTDIEGTTTQLSFVQKVLFPYAQQQLAAYVAKNQHQPAVQQVLQATRALLHDDNLSTAALIQQFLSWMEQDKKITPLKTLQGFIWEEGYRKGNLTAHIYPDAAEQLIRWYQQGLTLAVFSSGSILAQQLLFAHTTQGDLNYLFKHFFDTTTGAKNARQSYQIIAQTMELLPENILFLSDIPAELTAAEQAGMSVIGLARESTPQDNTHFFVKDFYAIHPEIL